MSSSVTDPKATEATTDVASPKGKGKAPAAAADDSMEVEAEEEEEEEDDEEEEEDSDDEEEEDLQEIDPSAIIGGRRTRGVKVDYTSQEALAKAGLTGNENDDEEEDANAMKE